MIFFLPPFIQAPTTITYTHVAENCVEAIHHLSKATGVPLAASASMKKEILLISVHNVSMQELLTKIATACDGEWTNHDGVNTLGRPAGYPRDLEAANLADQVAYVRNLRNEAEKQLGKLSSFTPEKARTTALALAAKLNANSKRQSDPNNQFDPQSEEVSNEVLNRSPLVRATLEAFLKCPVAASDPSRSLGTYFANEPNAYETNFSHDVSGLIGKLNTDESIYAKAIGGSFGSKVSSLSGKFWNANEDPAKRIVLLVLPKQQEVFLSLFVLDRHNKFLIRFDTVVTEHETYRPPEIVKPLPIPFHMNAEESMRQRALLDTFHVKQLPHLNSLMWNHLMHPAEYEPLAGLPSDELLYLGKQLNLQLVCDIPDSFDSEEEGLRFTKAPSLERFKSLAIDRVTHFYGDDKGWFVLYGGKMPGPLGYRVDRSDLQEYLNSSADGLPTLEAQAWFATHDPGGTEDAITSNAVAITHCQNKWPLMYGMFSHPPAIANMFRDNSTGTFKPVSLTLGELKPEVRRAVETAYIDDPAAIGFFEFINGVEQPPDLRVEKFPHGLPANTRIQLEIQHHSISFPTKGTVPGMLGSQMTGEEVGELMFAIKTMHQSGEEFFHTPLYLLAQRKIKFVFQIPGNKANDDWRGEEDHTLSSDKTFDELPLFYRERARKVFLQDDAKYKKFRDGK